MKRGCENKRGQINLSFGMIFSIILIIVFIAFAFYGIKKFLDFQKDVQISSFVKEFQDDVERMQQSFEGNQEKTYLLPTKIKEVCFVGGQNNLRLNAKRLTDSRRIEGIDIEKTLGNRQEYCIQNTEGKVTLNLEINYGENLVTIR
jgi:hypothetical protein